MKLEQLPASLIVIGGGAIGAELTQVFSRFGAMVTLLEVADRIIANEEPEASKVLTSAFGSEGVQVLAGVDIAQVAYDEGQFSVSLSGDNSADAEDMTIQADALLVAAGRRTNLTDLGLDTVGIDPTSKVLDTDEHMQVTAGLWAIGDITGKGAYTHMSMYQAKIAAKAVLAAAGEGGAPVSDGQAKSATAFPEPQEADYRAVPRVTFTDPEVGSVGMTEQQAREAGIRVQVGRSDLPSTSRGWLHKAGNSGLVKVVADAENGILVGGTAVSPSGGELLAALTLAVHARIPITTLRSMIYAFPTFHEAIRAALDDLSD
ncbi:MAG: FAD-dependent oxidoreductase [Nocardioidaceae bacterium]